MTFGSTLKCLRTEFGLTQSDLAKRLSLSKANVSKYESDSVEPNFETLTLISEIFNVSIDYLLGKTDEQTKTPSTGDGEGVVVEDNMIIIGRNGDVIKKKLSAQDISTISRMIEALPEDDSEEL